LFLRKFSAFGFFIQSQESLFAGKIKADRDFSLALKEKMKGTCTFY